MTLEDELVELARERDTAMQAALDNLDTGEPHHLLRHLRHYLSRQADHNRLGKFRENTISLEMLSQDLQELVCQRLKFVSGSELMFRIELQKQQSGWFVKRFQFHVKLNQPRTIKTVRIHLNAKDMFDALSIPRCHLHLDTSRPHVPFPVLNPRLILHFVCEHLEPDLAARFE